MKSNLIITSTLILTYLFMTQLMFMGNSSVQEYPALRARLGTIMHHSSDMGGVEHLYCYYPYSSQSFSDQSGEYILRRAQKLSDCSTWHGSVVFNEGSWVSEKEKIWWSELQQIQAGALAQN